MKQAMAGKLFLSAPYLIFYAYILPSCHYSLPLPALSLFISSWSVYLSLLKSVIFIVLTQGRRWLDVVLAIHGWLPTPARGGGSSSSSSTLLSGLLCAWGLLYLTSFMRLDRFLTLFVILDCCTFCLLCFLF